MLSPIIDKHVFEGNDFVFVTCVEAETTITVYSGAAELGKSVAKSSETIVPLGRSLQKDETLTAVA